MEEKLIKIIIKRDKNLWNEKEVDGECSRSLVSNSVKKGAKYEKVGRFLCAYKINQKVSCWFEKIDQNNQPEQID